MKDTAMGKTIIKDLQFIDEQLDLVISILEFEESEKMSDAFNRVFDFALTTFVKPSNITSRPVAKNIYSSKLIFALVAKYSASGNWDPMNCCQISSYKRFSSSEEDNKSSDLVDAFVGLIASWASWAFSLEE